MSKETRVSLNTLRPKQRAFLKAYITPGSETYGNATQSYHKVYGSTIDSARASASKTLSNDNIQRIIIDELDNLDTGIEVRINQLANIAKGLYRKTTIYEDVDVASGEITSRKVATSSPSPHDIVTANEIINKMTGLYRQQEIAEHASKLEIDKLYKQLSKELDI